MPEQSPRSEHVTRETSSLEGLPETVRATLNGYAELVGHWAPRLDLVAPGDLEVLQSRHIADSLRALPLLDSLPDGPAVEVGAGAGLPGIPLAIACRPRPWRLLEPRQKRAAFLEEVARQLELEVEVVTMTAEDAAKEPEFREHIAALARALAPPERAAELLLPLLQPRGTAILWVGEKAIIPPGSRLFAKGLVTIQKDDAEQEKPG